MPVNVIAYRAEYAHRFRDLNLDWLNRYFYVEEKDKKLLENCEETIIKPGGSIFFAEYKGEIAGCFSFIPYAEATYELGKMAVDPKFQGLRIGQELIQFAIAHARENDWEKIVLYSNTKLGSALHIYRKYGFVEVDLEPDLPYVRSDIKMELKLNETL